MKNFHILKFLTMTQNEIWRDENVEKKQMFRGNNTNLRKLRSLIPKFHLEKIFHLLSSSSTDSVLVKEKYIISASWFI